MSYFSTKAILLCSTSVGEKDRLYEFLTEDNTLLKAKEYGAQHTGGNCFSLYSTGCIYLYKKDSSNLCVLTDCELTKNRQELAVSHSVDIIPFIKVVKYFHNFFIKDFFVYMNYILDRMESDIKNAKMFVYLLEKIFTSIGNYKGFDVCSVCARILQRNEIAGLSSTLYSPSCNSCSDVRDVLLPGMRRYLDYILKLSFDDALSVNIYRQDLKRVLDFECMRLRLISKTFFSDMETYFLTDLT